MADTMPAIVELRPMGIGDILDATFRLYRARMASFATIALIAYIPLALYMLAVGLAFGTPEAYPDAFDFNSPDPFANAPAISTDMMLYSVGRLVFLWVVIPLAQAALIFNISGAILGERITAGESYRRAAGRLWPLLGTQILVGLVVMLGLIMCVVPGVIFSLWFMVTAPIVVLERLWATKAMGRSRELMSGNLGKGFVLLLVVFLLTLVIGMGTGMALGAIRVHPFFGEAGALIVEALLLPVQTAPLILFYYELRVRKEAFDLQRLSESVTTAPPPPVQGAAGF